MKKEKEKKEPHECYFCGKETFSKEINIFVKDYLCGKCKYDERIVLITKTTAKKEFKLTDEELEKIPSIEVNNPHYRKAVPMTLYLKQAVEARAFRRIVLTEKNISKLERKRKRFKRINFK